MNPDPNPTQEKSYAPVVEILPPVTVIDISPVLSPEQSTFVIISETVN